MTEERNRGGRAQAREPSEAESREDGAASSPGNAAARGEREDGSGSAEGLETRLPLEPGDGPRAPQGDALLDGNGSRHGVDARDERPSGG